jgi:hypothetical protein
MGEALDLIYATRAQEFSVGRRWSPRSRDRVSRAVALHDLAGGSCGEVLSALAGQSPSRIFIVGTWAFPHTARVSEPVARVARMMDGGGVLVSVGQVLDVFGGTVLLVPESTVDALGCEACAAFIAAAERATGSVVFVVPDEVMADF